MKTKIGFAVHDAARDGRAFVIEEESGQALVFGSAAAIPVHGQGVLPKHFVILPHEGMLLGASASGQAPAYVNDLPLGGEWAALELPCQIRLGAAVIEIFVLPAAAPQPQAFVDVEETRIGPLPVMVRPSIETSVEAPRAEAISSPSPADTTAARAARGPKDLAVLAARRLRDDYRRLSRPKRLLVPVAGLLAFLSLARPSQADDTTMPLAPPPQPAMSAPAQSAAPSARGLAFDAASSLSADPSVTPADSRLGRQALPSARSLPAQTQTRLVGQERVLYHRAIEATLAGDFATAYRLYDQLAAAHPEAGDLRAAQRVLAVKLKAAR
ncbi:MAG: hypothetical protein KF819_38975 [Labilithrix sp.]|nr:hypothetical protein [Labilithrix sp.]